MTAKRTLQALFAAVALLGPAAAPALSAPTDAGEATVEITVQSGAALSVTIQDATLTEVVYGFTAGTSTGVIIVNVSDTRGTALGWEVTIKGTDFIKDDDSVGANIPIENLGLAAASPLWIAGNLDHGSASGTPSVPHTLDSAAPIWGAPVGEGDGEYTAGFPATLSVPAGALVDTYVSTLTVEIAAGPS